jgi:hypothetical protein
MKTPGARRVAPPGADRFGEHDQMVRAFFLAVGLYAFLLSAGAVVILYSFTIPAKMRG